MPSNCPQIHYISSIIIIRQQPVILYMITAYAAGLHLFNILALCW